MKALIKREIDDQRDPVPPNVVRLTWPRATNLQRLADRNAAGNGRKVRVQQPVCAQLAAKAVGR